MMKQETCPFPLRLGPLGNLSSAELSTWKFVPEGEGLKKRYHALSQAILVTLKSTWKGASFG